MLSHADLGPDRCAEKVQSRTAGEVTNSGHRGSFKNTTNTCVGKKVSFYT